MTVEDSKGYMVAVCDTGNPKPDHPAKWAEVKITPLDTKRVIYLWFDKDRWAWLGEFETYPEECEVAYRIGASMFCLVARDGEILA